MYLFLLTIIYVSFISLGLPDSLLGSAWPVMRLSLGASIDFAGVISMIIAGSTIVSSLLSDRLTWKFGTGKVTAASVAMTAAALFGFSVSTAGWQLCLWAVPYGLGAGAVDAGLNNYVALHYNSRHMSWLHCFWGVGASISPYIMASFLADGGNWQGGYRAVSIMQFALTAFLIFTLSVWKVNSKNQSDDEEKSPPQKLGQILKIDGVIYVLIAFLCYCAYESTTGLWASSYLVEFRGVDKETAAKLASLFYLGITGGRFLSGFFADKLGDRNMIRIGIAGMFVATALILIPFENSVPSMAGLVMAGFGCAPVYPAVIHSTPDNFGRENSQAIIGVQMASAYAGTTFMPPLFGLIARYVSISLYPVYMMIFAVLLLAMTNKLNSVKKNKA